ncbi:MAG: hypothetical protein IID32_08750 [Planctomycetes bacterium]|nr:hypothetical protein [Planctomycetota bacterium]
MGEILVDGLCVVGLWVLEVVLRESFDDGRGRTALGVCERVVRIVLVEGKLRDLGSAFLLDDELWRREIVETELRRDIDERDDEDEIEREGFRARDDETLGAEGARREDDEDEIFRVLDFESPSEVSTEMSTNAPLNHTTRHRRVVIENLHRLCIVPTGATEQLASSGL